MNWYVIIGMALSAWTLLLILSHERQRRLMEIEARRQQAQAELLKRELEKQGNEVPVIG